MYLLIFCLVITTHFYLNISKSFTSFFELVVFIVTRCFAPFCYLGPQMETFVESQGSLGPFEFDFESLEGPLSFFLRYYYLFFFSATSKNSIDFEKFIKTIVRELGCINLKQQI